MAEKIDITAVPLVVWILVGCVLLAQGIWVFNDAPKRGMNRFVWGIFCLINSPSNLLVYLIVSRVILGGKECKSCQRKINKKYSYCPYCGEKMSEE